MDRIFDKDKVNKVLYGGDYNPEQWDMDTREKDMELFHEAGVDTVTINVFSWARLQKNENTYDFTELDGIVDQISQNGLNICMATSTAAHPAWMARKYPDILRTDVEGRKHKYGARHNSCPNSPTYRKYAPLLAKRLAERYKDRANIVAWHVSNEYGGSCYCENCENAFREWLKDRYETIDNLNYAWNTAFWSHTFYEWDEIVAPSYISETYDGGTCFNGASLDYKRFMSDSIMQNYVDEAEVIKSIIPDAVITTNFMMMFKELDYRKWAQHMDVVSWDSYPQRDTEPAYVAFNHDIMRGLKGGQPFMLMEQTPTVSSWLPVNTMKRPGEMRLLSYQAVAHGADTVMFFQMRQSPGGCEMYHGALIDHSGRNDTRSFKECATLGEELKRIGDMTIGGRTKASVAIVFDWESWWALEDASGINSHLKYPDEVMNYYRAFYEMNIPVDVIGYDAPIGGYDIVVAPLMYMVRNNIDERLKDYVRNGGVLLTTLLSGHVSEDGRALLGGFPGGALSRMCGIWNEEINMISPDDCNYFIYEGKRYEARLACSVLRTEGATSLCNYEEDYYSGMPVITRNGYGSGMVYYVGTTSEPDFYRHLVKNICLNSVIKDSTDSEILAQSANRPSTLEIISRENRRGKLLYVMNHSNEHEIICFTEDCKDILSGRLYRMGEQIHVNPRDVLVMKTVE